MKSHFPSLRSGFLALVCLLLPLLWLFRVSLSDGMIVFSNDGSFGMIMSQIDTAHEAITGHWRYLNWIGRNELEALPGLSQGIFFLLNSPVVFAKWFALIALWILGWSAFFLGRRLGLPWILAVAMGLAAELNSNPFSYACWGLAPKPLAFACFIIALALIEGSNKGWRSWIRVALAGFAIGINVIEAADVGIILSLYYAAYVAWDTLSNSARSVPTLALGASRLLITVVCAGWMGGHAVQVLRGYAVKDVTNMEATQGSSKERWRFITGWSLPPAETTRILAAGEYGYRMDTPDGGNYWGRVGEDGSPPRFSGSGEYAGISVLLLALWAVVRTLARFPVQPFTTVERRRILFWSTSAVISLLLAYGHYFPLFRLVFLLPGLNTIRIPMKYLHGFHLSVLLLFAYGLLGVFRTYFKIEPLRSKLMSPSSSSSENSASGFDRVWFFILGGLGSVFGLWALSSAAGMDSLAKRIAGAGFDAAEARSMATFSVTEIGISLLFFGLGGALTLPLRISFFRSINGLRNWGELLALLVAIDLSRAAAPWVVHYDYRFRYEKNPVVSYLQDRAADFSRTTARLVPFGRNALASPNDSKWGAVQNLWLEHHFQFFRIPVLDVIQMPRIPVLDEAFRTAFESKTPAQFNPALVGRLWQLTSTRFILGSVGIVSQLDSAVALPGSHFTPRLLFDLQPKNNVAESRLNQPDSWTAVVTTNGPYAVLEYDAALPRVGLYSSWTVVTNETLMLEQIVAPDFDARKKVILNQSPEIDLPAGSSSQSGEAKITAYAPREVTVSTKNSDSSVLVLNDRWHQHWNATLDGKPVPVLQANHIMKAVSVPAGEHQVRFRFDPPLLALKWTVLAIIAMVGMILSLLVASRSKET
ncbi:MAG: hypothetical protein EXS25_12015 [Pedosphaera sp.]|nr:hypothetical protein [Pedosphaera sp.]